jgi:predicted site-specific integrase-resolvase
MQVINIDKDTGKRVYSRKEVATICGVSAQTIKLWEDAGRIPASTRDENDYRYWYEDDLEAIIEYSKNPVKCGRKKKIIE